MKKKKISIAALLIVLFVVGIWGNQQYKKYQDNKNQEYHQFLDIYNAIEVEGYNSNPLLQGMTVDELKKNPPKVEMNGWKGLYVSAMSYEYYTKETIDYLEIEEWMNAGQALKVYEKYQDYIDWLNDSGGKSRNAYASSIIWLAGNNNIPLDKNSSYMDYKKIIEVYPDEISSEIAAIS